MLQQVIIAEGKSDAARIARAVEADVVITEGFTLRPSVVEQIRAAYERRGIIILTDPDGPGERIRERLTKLFPGALHAFVPVEEARADGDVGIENASPEAIRKALDKLHVMDRTDSGCFSVSDLLAEGLMGSPDASARRARLGAILGIGYGNARQLLKRLNHFGITRDEWDEAVAQGRGEGNA